MGLFRVTHTNFEKTFSTEHFDTTHTNEWEDAGRLQEDAWKARYEYEAALIGEVIQHNPHTKNVLEIGSGPGILSQKILESFPDLNYHLVDKPFAEKYFKEKGFKGKFFIKDLSSSFDTSGQIAQIPFGVGEDNFPLATASLSSYTVNTTYGGSPIYVEVVCPFYYTPVRIQWKNRYGQFDYLNFYKVHTETFSTEQRTYQPQLGSWGDGTTLSYNQYQTTIQRYIVDTNETLDVNTDWLPESYNEILKQLLVTDEVYWMYDMPNNLVKPLSIKTNNITFKTGVNNKLIQYTFSFDVGQTYKQLL